MPPQLREIGCHVQNHATQWHDFQHEIQFQEIGVAWIQLTLKSIGLNQVQTFLELGIKATTKTVTLLGISICMMARILAQVIEDLCIL